MPVDKIHVAGDPRIEYKSATVNGHKYSESRKPWLDTLKSPKTLHRPYMENEGVGY
jgi:hypothetical protein